MRYLFALINTYPFISFCLGVFVIVIVEKITDCLNVLIIVYEKKIELLKQKNIEKEIELLTQPSKRNES